MQYIAKQLWSNTLTNLGIVSERGYEGPLKLTWINFNPNMDK